MQQPIDSGNYRFKTLPNPAANAKSRLAHIRNPASAATVVIFFAGEYDFRDKASLRQALQRVAHVKKAVLDLTYVTFVDAASIHELVRLHNMRALNGLEPETLVGCSPHLRKLFGILELSKLLHVVDELEEAITPADQDIELDYAPALMPGTAVLRPYV
jgi:anti-anti-sigma factor